MPVFEDNLGKLAQKGELSNGGLAVASDGPCANYLHFAPEK